MFTIHKETIDWGGRPLVIETGKIARQADGAVLVTYGETSVLATAVAARTPKMGKKKLTPLVKFPAGTLNARADLQKKRPWFQD
jgi:polyribonucleotide nucleotidyltransferase